MSDFDSLLQGICDFRKVDFSSVESFLADEARKEAEECWKLSPKNLVSDLPEFDQSIADLEKTFRAIPFTK